MLGRRFKKVESVESVEKGREGMVSDFEELIIYKQSRELAKRIYQITREGEFRFDTRFVQQIRASAGSVGDNIAEGFERQGKREFLQFLYIAKGSCGELRSQINRAYDVGFVNKDIYEQIYSDCRKLGAGILNFIQSLKAFESKGSKYQEEERKVRG